jgi:hypothetical protein
MTNKAWVNVCNKRVSGSVGWWSLPEPYGSGFSGLFGLNHSDSAAHAKH